MADLEGELRELAERLVKHYVSFPGGKDFEDGEDFVREAAVLGRAEGLGEAEKVANSEEATCLRCDTARIIYKAIRALKEKV